MWESRTAPELLCNASWCCMTIFVPVVADVVKSIEHRRLCKMRPISSVSFAPSMRCLGRRTFAI